MKIVEGTKSAKSLLERLAAEGDLVDVYSNSFFDRQPSAKDDPFALFNQEVFEYMLEEYEFNSDSDLKPAGHLLFIHVDQYKSDLSKELVNVYKPLGNLIAAGKHDPDFLIMNLYTRQVLCIGLGRKNRLFAIDATTGKNINVFGLLRGGHAADVGIFASDDHYMDKFTEHDVYESVSDLVHALHKLGVAMYNYDGMLANHEQIDHSIDLPPNDDGLYQLKDWDDQILSEERFTKDELVSMLEEINGYQAAEDEAMKVINVFFPQCERFELSTGDY